MKFDGSVKINAPKQFVYATLTDIDHIKNKLPNSVIFSHVSGPEAVEQGARFNINYERLGRRSDAKIDISNTTPSDQIDLNIKGSRLSMHSLVTFHADGDATTLKFDSELSPNSMLGRILIQSIRASRSRLNARIDTALKSLAASVEDEYEG